MSNSWPDITQYTTIEGLFENGDKPETPYLHNCVFCEYSYLLNKKSDNKNLNRCMLYPVQDEIGCETGLYDTWNLNKTSNRELTAIKLAKQIRDITINKE